MKLSDFNSVDATTGMKTIEFSVAINLDMTIYHHFLLVPDTSNLGVSVPNMGSEAIYASFNNPSDYSILLTIGNAGTYILEANKTIFGYWNLSEWMVSTGHPLNITGIDKANNINIPQFSNVTKDNSNILITNTPYTWDIIKIISLKDPTKTFASLRRYDNTNSTYVYAYGFGSWTSVTYVADIPHGTPSYEPPHGISSQVPYDYINDDIVIIPQIVETEFNHSYNRHMVDILICRRDGITKNKYDQYGGQSDWNSYSTDIGINLDVSKIYNSDIVMHISRSDSLIISDYTIRISYNINPVQRSGAGGDSVCPIILEYNYEYYNNIINTQNILFKSHLEISNYNPPPAHDSPVKGTNGEAFITDQAFNYIKYLYPFTGSYYNKPVFEYSIISGFCRSFKVREMDENAISISNLVTKAPTFSFQKITCSLLYDDSVIGYKEVSTNHTVLSYSASLNNPVINGLLDSEFYESIPSHEDYSNVLLSSNNLVKFLKVYDKLFSVVYNDYYNNGYLTFMMIYYNKSINTFIYSDKYVLDTTINDISTIYDKIHLYLIDDNYYILEINNVRYHLT